MSLEVPVIASLDDGLRSVLFLFRVLHMSMALNVLAILMKFFKFFESNARLQVVPDTLALAFEELCHFMIVFFAVFNGFVVTGHILLGNDFVHFNSFGASFNTAFLCLMGDFGWYSDLTNEIEPLGSSLPYFVVSFWFWSFMIFTLLVLLNMLLAIIMDSYGCVTGDLALMPDAPFLWQQCSRYYTRMKLYRKQKWTPLSFYCKVFDKDEDGQTHPEAFVTHESLMNAFPEMKTEQATFLMKWLQKDANALASLQEDDEGMLLIDGSHKFMATIAENLNSLILLILRCDTTVVRIKRKQANGSGQAPPQAIGFSSVESLANLKSISGHLESQQKAMQELGEQLAEQARASDGMAQSLANIAKTMS